MKKVYVILLLATAVYTLSRCTKSSAFPENEYDDRLSGGSFTTLDVSTQAFKKAIELKPSDVSFLNNLAFVLATTPDASLRNGSKAIDLAKRANELSDWNQPDVLATLAAAYAELHRFTDAVEIGQKADQLAKLQGNLRLAQRIEHDIQLYREGNPLRLGSLTDPGSKAP